MKEDEEDEQGSNAALPLVGFRKSPHLQKLGKNSKFFFVQSERIKLNKSIPFKMFAWKLFHCSLKKSNNCYIFLIKKYTTKFKRVVYNICENLLQLIVFSALQCRITLCYTVKMNQCWKSSINKQLLNVQWVIIRIPYSEYFNCQLPRVRYNM